MLLFDEHLSPKLCHSLAVEFPESIHVHQVGLGNENDLAIWEFARDKDLVIVTKDSDFPDLQGVKGFPPKIIWVRIGNSSTAEIVEVLRDHHLQIRDMRSNEMIGLLIIR